MAASSEFFPARPRFILRPFMSLSTEQLARLEHQQALFRSIGDVARSPYFGHMRLDTGQREADILLGQTALTHAGVSIIDWRSAPIAEVFFAYEEGEAYEVEIEDRIVTGRVLEKNLLAFDATGLVAIESRLGVLRRSAAGAWSASEGPSVAPIAPRPAAARRPFRSPLEVRLDAAQQRIVDLPVSKSVLILGEAGFGKTTVALHRLVSLQERVGPRFRAAVMVPTEGLRRLTRLMLERRGVRSIDVWTYEEWAAKVARRAFRDLPKKESENATGGTVRFKRHPALEPVLADFVQERPKPAREDDRPRQAQKARARWADLEHLFGDARLMRRVAELSEGALSPTVVAEVIEHTRVQFSRTADREYAHVRLENRTTVDGRGLDEGTPMEDASSVDSEDYAVLFELDRLRARAQRAKPYPLATYDCLLVDEAQEFSPLELKLMARSVKPQGTVIVAGDAAQQVDPTASFPGWPGVLKALGVPWAERAVLEVNYRCPEDVTALARSVLDPNSPRAAAEPSITRAPHASAFHLAVWLTRSMLSLLKEDPQASITVIARTNEAAKGIERWLQHGVVVRIAADGDFSFRPGATVTSVPEVKGLEFDYVVVPDASASTYPATQDARRSLYVAVTRATFRLALASAGPFSPLLD